MALGYILITSVPMPSGVVSSKYRSGNNPEGTPSLVGAPTTLKLVYGVGGTYDFGQHGRDPDNDYPLTYALVGDPVSGITMSSTGILTVDSSVSATIYNLVISVTDPGLLSSTHTLTLTIVLPETVSFTIPATTEVRTISGDVAVAYTLDGVDVTWASLSPSGKVLPTGGDIIQLAAGTHGPIKFRNIRGTSLSDLIYIRGPQTGNIQAIIRRVTPYSGGFVVDFTECRFFKLDGYLASSPESRYCGIKIMYASAATTASKDGASAYLKFSASSANSTFGVTDNCIVSYIEIDGGWNSNNDISVSSNGIGISTAYTGMKAVNFPGKYQENITIEYNWVKNTQGEGMYIGPNWYIGSLPCRNATVRYNRTENTNYTGIQLKSWISGINTVYGNYVYDAGFAGNSGQWNGMQCVEGSYQVFGNHIERCYNTGLLFWNGSAANEGVPTSYGNLESVAYNNVVVDAGFYGIHAGGYEGYAPYRAQIYNNTVIRSDDIGISLASTCVAGSYIRNNLIADSTGDGTSPASSTSAVAVAGNRIGTVAAQNFVNDAESNYRLTSSSPARDAVSSGYPITDFDGIVTRPFGASADQGAFEYVT